MKAEIITSGTELLLGESIDANTSFLARQLAVLGIDLYYASTVGDNYDRYSGVIRQAWSRSDLVITTGGLGPTRGDITRDVIAGLLGEKMAVDADLKKEITEFFARRGIEMPENNLRQATLIPSAVPLHNIAGTAPGWWVEKDSKIIVSLPGPPAEMQSMWLGGVLPRLEAKSGSIILSRTLKTWGVSEAKIDQLVSPFLSCASPTLAIYAKQDGIHLRITAKAKTKEIAAAIVAGRERDIREVLGDSVWGTDDETLEGVVGYQLKSKSKSLAIAETVTAGLLTQLISSTPGSHEYFKGSMILNSDEAREKLGIKPRLSIGANKDTALKMASAARSMLATNIGLSVEGYCEKSGNELASDIFIAIDEGSKSKVLQEHYAGTMQQIARRTVNYTLVNLMAYLRDTRFK
jgi:nicotinamide-nucleotide amidase